MQTVRETSGLAYEPVAGAYDEAFDEGGDVRPHYRALIEALGGVELAELVRAVGDDLRARGASFHRASGNSDFLVDPVPRLIESDEWAAIERGIRQRVRALNAFLADVYGERRIVAAGVIPARVIQSADHHEPRMRDVPVPHGVYAGAVGLDLARDSDGRLYVLEDNTRTPSGYTYVLAARDTLDERLPEATSDIARAPVADTVERLAGALRAAAPDGVDDPQIALLSDGESNSAWWEHKGIAGRLGLPIVTLDVLEVRGGRVYARIEGESRPIDVLYRRTDEVLLDDERGQSTPFADKLLEPLENGTLAMFNAFGAGVADDKLTYAYVPAMISFYLGEEPLLGCVETLDLGEPDQLEQALDRLDELVFKERWGEGGYGVTIAPHATRADLDALRADVTSRPGDFIAQRVLTLSTHPTVIDGWLEPRHIDLRAFALQSGDHVHVVPGGLTRVAFGEGALVVNSSQNGGGKDTWVLR